MTLNPHALGYISAIFDQPDLERAKRIILTPEAGLTTAQRWERETAWLRPKLVFPNNALVLDYGCGVGRLSKNLVAMHHDVIGVDISASMRRLAIDYVASDQFVTMAPVALEVMAGTGLRVHGAICCWTLQHAAEPETDVAVIANAMIPGSTLFLLNMKHRALPTKHGWIDDGVDIFALMDRHFDMIAEHPALPPDIFAAGAVLRSYRRQSR